MTKLTKTEIDSLIAQAWAGREKAYAPYSRFKVGAAVLGANGKMYNGCNIENASFGLTNCAERTAIFKMVSDGCQTFTAIAVAAGEDATSAPCGACRQVLLEFCEDLDTMVYDTGANGEILEVSIRELVPYPFMKFTPSND